MLKIAWLPNRYHYLGVLLNVCFSYDYIKPFTIKNNN